MGPFRSSAVTIAVALAGAVWGAATFAIVDSIRFAGESLPADLVLGPLVLADRLLPPREPLFPLISAWYGTMAALLWRARESRPATIMSLVLWGLLLAGPLLALGTTAWTKSASVVPTSQQNWAYFVARDGPLQFAAMTLGILGWQAFAWFRLARVRQPDWVPLLAAAFAATAFGGALWWSAEVLTVSGRGTDLPLLLAVGPIPWLQSLARTPPEAHFAAPALTYGLLGYLLAASRISRVASRIAPLVFAACLAATFLAIGASEATSPGSLLRELQSATWVARAAPSLFAWVLLALVGWNAVAVWILCQSWLRASHYT